MTSPRVRRARRLWAADALLIAVLIGLHLGGGSGHSRTVVLSHRPPASVVPKAHRLALPAATPRYDPRWTGNGQPVTLAFAGDVSFPPGSALRGRLAVDPATALGPTVPELFSGANLAMVNFESALTDGTCPASQPKQYVFYAPRTAITAFKSAGITLVTEANNHGEDCGPAGLQMALQAKQQTGYPILGIGQDVSRAFTPFVSTINGERVAIIAATEVIDSNLQAGWTATGTQPGLASAYDVTALISEVQSVRKTADTVAVYLHWGTELQTCPSPLQEPLAHLLVKAGADIVVGTHAHVLLGGGYLGSAYIDYGLGNFAFYDNGPPGNVSGSLVITATGRHIDSATWRPAVIVNDRPQPLSGPAAANAVARWSAHRDCTDATAIPGPSLANASTETTPAPAAEVQPLSLNRGRI